MIVMSKNNVEANDGAQTNLLLITTDQQRFDTIAALGARNMLTPHLDWLVNGGITYTRAYADAPICVPARATMITGKHYINMPEGCGDFGQPTLLSPKVTLPALLSRHGYQTKSVGKLHYHPVRANYGWEHAEILADYYWEMARHPEWGVPMHHGLGQNEMQPALSTVEESHSLTQWTVDRAVRFLETRDNTRPFCLHVGFTKPHPPFDPCRNYWELYADLPQPEPIYGDWSEQADNIHPAFMQPTWTLNGADELSPDILRACRRAYAALITQIDYSLGILFSRLRELGLLENTLVLFCSDHGEMLGDHHMGAKTVYLEGSAHIPMIMRLPSSHARAVELRGKRCDELVCHADIMPTFLRAAGISLDECPPGDGLDLIAVAAGSSRRERLVARYRDYYAVIEPVYKYMTTGRGGELLFNLKNDPMEQNDLVRTQACSVEHHRLSELLRGEIEKRGLPRPDSSPPMSRKEIRATRSWPGFHSRCHTADDVLH